MKFIRYPNKSPLSTPTVVTIGNFDGVHLGHQYLINQVVAKAAQNRLQSVVVTMQPLASEFFNKQAKITVLTPFKSKYHLIKKLKVDYLCVLNFNQALAQLSAEAFIQDILLDGLKAQYIIVGDDFRFGKNRLGDFELLKHYCQPRGIVVQAIESIVDKHVRISSSAAREQLSLNHFQRLEDLLGRRFSIEGKVTKGQQVGREIDFPTINIKLKNRYVPLHGIYCVTVKLGNNAYLGAASIGTRPTVGGVEKILEVHILDFNQQVYGQNVKVLFYQKLRNEVKFATLTELQRHIQQDVIKTRLFFSNYNQMESLREQ